MMLICLLNREDHLRSVQHQSPFLLPSEEEESVLLPETNFLSVSVLRPLPPTPPSGSRFLTLSSQSRIFCLHVRLPPSLAYSHPRTSSAFSRCPGDPSLSSHFSRSFLPVSGSLSLWPACSGSVLCSPNVITVCLSRTYDPGHLDAASPSQTWSFSPIAFSFLCSP